jgi:hypothetical protein
MHTWLPTVASASGVSVAMDLFESKEFNQDLRCHHHAFLTLSLPIANSSHFQLNL